jgi:hypothetical protein
MQFDLASSLPKECCNWTIQSRHSLHRVDCHPSFVFLKEIFYSLIKAITCSKVLGLLILKADRRNLGFGSGSGSGSSSGSGSGSGCGCGSGCGSCSDSAKSWIGSKVISGFRLGTWLWYGIDLGNVVGKRARIGCEKVLLCLFADLGSDLGG